MARSEMKFINLRASLNSDVRGSSKFDHIAIRYLKSGQATFVDRLKNKPKAFEESFKNTNVSKSLDLANKF